MQQDISQAGHHDDEIDLIKITEKLIESKKIIILTTLIITISAYMYSIIKKPVYRSNLLIEIGHYELNNGSIEILDDPKSIIQDLRINLIYKDLDNDFSNPEQNIELNIIEDKLIKIQHSSKSFEKNIDILNQFLSYLNTKHSNLANTKYQEKRALITKEFDSINSEINFTEKLLLAQNEDERLKLSNQIIALTNQLPFIDKQISNLDQVITQDQENLLLLKSEPNLYIERTSKSPTLNQVIYSYKKDRLNLFKLKQEKLNKISLIEEQLKLLENAPLQNEKVFELLQTKVELEMMLKDLENQNFSKTQTIGEIETRRLDLNKILIIFVGFLLGLITSFLLVFFNTFVENYRKK